MIITTHITSPRIPQKCISCGENSQNILKNISFSDDNIKIKGLLTEQKSYKMSNGVYGSSRNMVQKTYSYRKAAFSADFPICESCKSFEENITIIRKRSVIPAIVVSIILGIFITISSLKFFHFHPASYWLYILVPIIMLFFIFKLLRGIFEHLFFNYFRRFYPKDLLDRKGCVCLITYAVGTGDLAVEDKLTYNFRNKTYCEEFTKENSSIVVKPADLSGMKVKSYYGHYTDRK